MQASHPARHILVSCVTGRSFNNLYPAPVGWECVLFSNNPNLKITAERTGWRFVPLNQFTLSPDDLESSIQAKYVKFLQFLDDFAEFRGATSITYFDHKFYVQPKHVRWILDNYRAGFDVLVRETPKLKLSIDDEVHAALGQERYARNMDQTVRWFEGLIGAGRIQRRVRIVNTGLIHYANIGAARALTDLVYQKVLMLRQPECQIIWAAAQQLVSTRIQVVPWQDLEPAWAAP